MTDANHSHLEQTLPGSYYFSDDIFRQEQEHIFAREWFCVGRAETVPNVGDFVHLDIVGQSILLVRTRQGDLRAFYNVCRHRGCRVHLPDAVVVPADGQHGRTGSFPGVIRCPYHSWTYELDGRLRSAPFLNDAIDKAALGLYAVDVQTWGGFVFVNLSPDRPNTAQHTLLDQLGAFTLEYTRNYPLADLRAVHRLTYTVEANWKTIFENYNECYHCGPVHPELCAIVPAFKHQGGLDLPWEDGIAQREGTYTYTFSGTSNRAPFPGLSPDEQVKHKARVIYPNMMLSLSADHAAHFLLWPQSPTTTVITCDFLFHPDAIARPEFDPTDVIEFWDVVNRQDWVICEGVQKGMTTRVFDHGYYAPMEDWSADIRRYVHARLPTAEHRQH